MYDPRGRSGANLAEKDNPLVTMIHNSMTSPTVQRVLRGDLCAGCGLCASVSDGAIQMVRDPSGYNRPEATGAALSVHAEDLIAAACPGVRIESWSGIAPDVDAYWGPSRTVATGFATDGDVRYEGSSGGVVSALAIQALVTGCVDRVLHIGADPAAPTRNIVRLSRTREEVISGAGSRYTASSPLSDIIAEVQKGGRIAFVGKPCDVSALRRLARRDPAVERGVPIMLAFFCAGIPSHGGVDRILAEMGVALPK